MRKILFFTALLLCFNGKAQNYSFSLVHNSEYSFSVVAVPDFDSGSFEPMVQFYGFTLVLPAGTTVTVDDIQPNGLTLIGGSYSIVPGTAVSSADASMSDKSLLLFATDASSGLSIGSHTSGQQISMITFIVNGSPSSGELTLLGNDTLTGLAYPALQNFYTIDAYDDSVFSAVDLYSGQTGTSSFDFATLDIVENTLHELTVYPNPVADAIRIKGDVSKIEVVELYSMSGKLIYSISNSFESIDVKGLDSAVYFIKLKSGNSTRVIKIVKD